MVQSSFQKYLLACSLLVLPMAHVVAADEESSPASPPPKGETVKKAPTREELFSTGYIDRLSQTYGHLIQRSLNNPMVKLNPQGVIQGIQDGIAGKKSPLSEQEYEEALQLIQQYAYEDMSSQNLAEAEGILSKNKGEQGVVLLEDGKLQYKIEKEGAGDAVTEDTVPTINYNATFSNGQKLGSSEQTGGPIDVNLTDTIPGFHKGILGMKVGEKRRIWIHPDLGFGKSGQLPNGLLIFEIEVTKVAPKPAKTEQPEAEDDDDDLSSLLNTADLFADDEDEDDDDDDEDDNEDIGDELETLQIEEVDLVMPPTKMKR